VARLAILRGNDLPVGSAEEKTPPRQTQLGHVHELQQCLTDGFTHPTDAIEKVKGRQIV